MLPCIILTLNTTIAICITYLQLYNLLDSLLENLIMAYCTRTGLTAYSTATDNCSPSGDVLNFDTLKL